MGFDIYGKNPDDPVGEYFRNNVWWWRPLWNYCTFVAPKITKKVKHGHTNDGDGLTNTDATKLATILRTEIAAGHTKQFETEYDAWCKSLPQIPCEVCGGTGKRKPVPKVGPGDVPCNGCHGTGKIDDWNAHYPFTVENVEEFTNFLEHCGGFEIW